jgi:hypothetical protein
MAGNGKDIIFLQFRFYKKSVIIALSINIIFSNMDPRWKLVNYSGGFKKFFLR